MHIITKEAFHGACLENCVNGHSEVKYGHGTKEGKERKGYYRPIA
jgi:hypothetical protein